MTEMLYALDVRDDQDGSIEQRRRDGRYVADALSACRNVATGYNTQLSYDFRHAGQITMANLQHQRLKVPSQLDAMWERSPNAVLGVLDFTERFQPAAADARLADPVGWAEFKNAVPPTLQDLDAEYERRVQEHFCSMAVSCCACWEMPWLFPTCPGTRYFGWRGGMTNYIGYPQSDSPDFPAPCQTENDRVARKILAFPSAVMIQAGYFDAQWEPGHEGKHWESGMWEAGRISRADLEAKIRGDLAEAERLCYGPQVYAMASPHLRRGDGTALVNQATWELFTGICSEQRVPIVLWGAFKSIDPLRRFAAWCKEARIDLPVAANVKNGAQA